VRRLTVELGERSYPVVVGHGVAREVAEYVTGRAVIVRDRRAPRLLELDVPEVLVDGGEACKTLNGVAAILAELEHHRIGRDGTVIAVGGGSVTDLAGFAAAVWQRGVGLVNIPTTLLGMVDAGIGGKTGVNSETAKNAIGAFWQPRAVLCDLRALETLPQEEIDSAFAEVVKYDITLDPGVSEVGDIEEVVARSAKAKADVVAGDEREGGAREVLNYGHTAGHAIEAATGYRLAHGRCVAVGMRIAARLSARLARCDPGLVALQDQLLARHRLLSELPKLDVADVLGRLGVDKKARGGRPRWVLPLERGRAVTGCDVPDGLVEEVAAEIIRGA
jgi:3-dehydroquinate synthetase